MRGRKLFLSGVFALVLGLASVLNGPANAQITTSGGSSLPATIDQTIAEDDIFAGWGTDDDFRLEFVSATDEFVIKDDADVVVLQVMDFPGVVADYADTFMVNLGAGGTVAIMDNSDDYSILQIDVVNANHTGSSNFLNGLEIVGITGDAQASEAAIRVGNGWDNEILFSDTLTQFVFAATGGTMTFRDGANIAQVAIAGRASTNDILGISGRLRALESTDAISVTPTIGVMDGSDTYNLINLDVTNGNHTGTGNTLNLISIDAITGDANSNLNGILIGALTGTTGAATEIEVAINIGNGWDTGLNVGDGGILMGVTYENYEVACGALQTDGTVQSNTDTEVNDIICPASGLHHTVINVGANTAFAFANPAAGGVTMFNTATDNIGEEVRFSSDPLVGYGAVGTTGVYFVEFSITIANISAFDGNLGIGLMQPEGSVAGLQDNLNTYSLFTLSDNAGDLDLECDLDGGGLANDDTGITWADTQTKALRIELQTDGGSVWLVDGVTITSTNCDNSGNNDWTAADKIVPFIMGSTGAEGVSTGFVLNYIKFGEL